MVPQREKQQTNMVFLILHSKIVVLEGPPHTSDSVINNTCPLIKKVVYVTQL